MEQQQLMRSCCSQGEGFRYTKRITATLANGTIHFTKESQVVVFCQMWVHSFQHVYHDLSSVLELPLESANACQHGTCLCDHVILQHPVLKEANNRTCILLHTLNLKI
jgi:hypothetical protein